MKVILFLSLTAFLTVNAAITQRKTYKMPASCEGKTYCTVPGDDYPSNDILAAVKKWKPLPTIHQAPEFSQRDGELGLMDCRAQYENATIYFIVDKYGVTHPVIQLENIFKQTHEIRYCRDSGPYKNCADMKLKSLQKQPSCSNQYMFFDFLILNSDKVVELIQAEIPVCCKCHI